MITATNVLPPQNIEAEEAILGAILLDPEAINQVADILPTAAFSLFSHQEIYKATLTLYNGGKPTDLMTVSTWLADRNLLEKVGGQSKLAQLVDRTVSAVNIDQYAALVVDKWQRRQLIQAGQRIAELGHDTGSEISALRLEAEKALQWQGVGGNTQSIEELLPGLFDAISQWHQDGGCAGIPTGFPALDKIILGWQNNDLILLGARPSMGKTALALAFAMAAAGAKIPTLIFSLEMSSWQLAQRLVSAESGVPLGLIRSGLLLSNHWDALSLGFGRLSEFPLVISDQNLSLLEMRAIARRKKPGLIILDYLQLMEDPAADKNRVQELSRITRGLKLLAKELNCPIIALAQLSRGLESRNDKRPTLADLRDSGSLEQDADLVLMIYRDEYYNPSTPDRGVAEVIIAKHRNGPTGIIKLGFDPELTKFKNLN